MWVLFCLILCPLTTCIATSASGDLVKTTCQDCEGGDGVFWGWVGGSVTVHFNISNINKVLRFAVSYNSSHKIEVFVETDYREPKVCHTLGDGPGIYLSYHLLRAGYMISCE